METGRTHLVAFRLAARWLILSVVQRQRCSCAAFYKVSTLPITPWHRGTSHFWMPGASGVPQSRGRLVKVSDRIARVPGPVLGGGVWV